MTKCGDYLGRYKDAVSPLGHLTVFAPRNVAVHTRKLVISPSKAATTIARRVLAVCRLLVTPNIYTRRCMPRQPHVYAAISPAADRLYTPDASSQASGADI